MWATSLEGPLGPLRLVCTADALVGITFPDHAPAPRYTAEDGAHPLLTEAATQLRAWLDGRRTTFDLPLHLEGTDFQQAVWAALRAVPFGATTTYGELAAALGRPGAARAVGAAVGRNPLSIVVPCHRVVGTDGRLTGFAGGIQRKRWLLAHESGAGALFSRS